jgi:uncharacterized membrane protein
MNDGNGEDLSQLPQGAYNQTENPIIGDEQKLSSRRVALMCSFLIVTIVTYSFLQFYIVEWNWANLGVGIVATVFYAFIGSCGCFGNGCCGARDRKNSVQWVSSLCAVVAAVIGVVLWILRLQI